MSGKASRRKGHQWERDVANRFKPIFGYAKRGWQCRDGSDAPDVVVPHFWVECKRGKKVNIRAALKQAIDACEKEELRVITTTYGPDSDQVSNSRKLRVRLHMPIAICKDDREQPIVAMLFDDFLDLVKEWWDRGNRG